MSRGLPRPLIRALAVVACATFVLAQQDDPPEARAQLIDQGGNEVGEANFATTDDGAVRMRIQVRGLAAAGEGERGLHIHEVGRCDPPDFDSAGDHFNPTGAEHGLLHPDGPARRGREDPASAGSSLGMGMYRLRTGSGSSAAGPTAFDRGAAGRL